MAASQEKQNTPKLVKAFARDLRLAPRKLRLVSNMVRGMRVSDALTQLEFTNKKGAELVSKLIKSAVANAHNNFSLDPESLYIKTITTDMGKVLARYFPRARGSAFIIRRKLAHLNIVLEEKKSLTAKEARFKMPAKKAEPEVKEVNPDDQAVEQGAVEPNTGLPKQAAPKTGEQRKAGQIQQKRRLFNRKSGE